MSSTVVVNTVTTQQSKENAALSAFGFPVVVQDGLLRSYRYSDALIQSEFTESTTGSGSYSIVDGSALQLNSGAASSSSIKLTSKKRHKYTSGRGQKTIMSIILGDTGVAGNVREWGYGDDNNGAFIRLDGTTLKFILKSNGSEIAAVDASSWDIPVTPDANGHLWYIQFEWLGVGNFFIYYDQQLVHTYEFLGTSTAPSMEDPDLPIRFRNENTTNSSNVILKNICAAVSSEGRNLIELEDENQNLLEFSTDGRIRTEAFGTTLMSDNFAGNFFDTDATWDETIVGSASKSLTNSILSLSVTTASSDSITETYTASLSESVGAFCELNVKYSFGDTLVANNVREWGYLDAGSNDGIFFRLTGSTFAIVFVKGGVETAQNIDSALPDSDFHKYTIKQSGLDNISVFIDDVRIYASENVTLVGDKFKKPFLKNYNSAALGGTASASQVSWINLLDSSGRSTIVIGKDSAGGIQELRFDDAGRVLTSAESPPAGPGETSVSRSQRGSLSGTNDDLYTIPSGKTLQIRSLIGGVENNGAGCDFTLFEDPNGDLSTLDVIPGAEIIIDGGTQQNNLAVDIEGDGTKRILLRLEQLTGGSYKTTSSWSGVLK